MFLQLNEKGNLECVEVIYFSIFPLTALEGCLFVFLFFLSLLYQLLSGSVKLKCNCEFSPE